MAMNPFCEIAVEEAVRLKEKGVASEIVVSGGRGMQNGENFKMLEQVADYGLVADLFEAVPRLEESLK